MQIRKHALTLFLAVAMIVSCTVLPVAAEEEKVAVYSENFDSFANHSEAQVGLSKVWKLLLDNVWDESSGFSLADHNDGKALKISWIGGRMMQARNLALPENYEITFQAKGGTDSAAGGFFFLHALSENYQVAQVFDLSTNTVRDAVVEDVVSMSLYESDGDRSSDFGEGVGYAGIYIKLHKDKLYIAVKTEEAHSASYIKGIGNLRYAAQLPAGKSFDRDYVDIKIIEKDKRVSFYAGDTLLGSVVYSEENGRYFTKAVIYDAAGKEAASTDRAKICTENVIGYSVRNSSMYLDNIKIDSLSGSVNTLKVVPIYDESYEKGAAERILADVEIAFRVTAAPGDAFKSVTYKNMPTYTGANTAFRFSVYKWMFDYDTTMEGEPVYDTVISNHKDYQDCVITFPEPLGSGHYLAVLSEGKQGDNDSSPGIWLHEAPEDRDILVFYNGEEKSFGLFAECTMIEGGDPDGTVADLNATPTPNPHAPTPSAAEPTESPSAATADTSPVASASVVPSPVPSASPENASDTDGSPLPYIILAVCGAVIIGAVVFLILFKRKKAGK